MVIPMGTVITVCMLLAVLLGLGARYLTPSVKTVLATITAAAGAWNVLWYGLRHIGEFWGHMALASGAVMLILSYFILRDTRQAANNSPISRIVLSLLLLPFALYYGWTIYNL